MKYTNKFLYVLAVVASASLSSAPAWARDVKYNDSEVSIAVNPGEPTQVEFPNTVAGGYKKKLSAVTIDKRGASLVIFGSEGLPDEGEAIIVRLTDGRSYSLRVQRAADASARDTIVKIQDGREGAIGSDEEESPSTDKAMKFAPPSTVNGLIREMVLSAEFGKEQIQGYRVSDQMQGEVVLDDGTLVATVEKVFIGPNLWGYVIDAENKLDTAQKINPASFRIDGTRAISLSNWELAPRPLTNEQAIAQKHKSKVYVVARARRIS